MKRTVVLVLALVLLMAGSAFAQQRGKSASKSASKSAGGDMVVDGMLSLATEPVDGFGMAIGFGVGFSKDITREAKMRQGKLMARGDLNYYSWSQDTFGVEVTLSRMPIFLGGRYYIPMQGQSNMDVYAEGGLEISFDKAEACLPSFFPGQPPICGSASDTNIGITPGAGIEFPINNNMTVGANARLHLITDSYLTIGATLGYKF